jgi:uncharacterized repeat protein (TIGR03803 family)
MRDRASLSLLGRLLLGAMLAVLPCLNAEAQTPNILYSFTGGSDGSGPSPALVSDAAGNLYGTAAFGGISSELGGNGVVFELSPASGGLWTVSVLYSFAGAGDGYWPTSGGGTSGCGGIFAVSLGASGWRERNVYDSDCVGGGLLGVSAVDGAGAFLGAGSGGVYGAGDIYEFVP